MTATTVYEFGNYRFVKDMIFGWCLSYDHSAYLPLADFDDQTLDALNRISYPIYVPGEFQEAVRAELRKRQAATEASQTASPPTTPKEEPELLAKLKLLQQEHGRQRDRITLLTEMLNKAASRQEGTGIIIDLDYVKVINTGKTQPPWVLIGANGVPLAEGYATIEEVVDRIMARWW